MCLHRRDPCYHHCWHQQSSAAARLPHIQLHWNTLWRHTCEKEKKTDKNTFHSVIFCEIMKHYTCIIIHTGAMFGAALHFFILWYESFTQVQINMARVPTKRHGWCYSKGASRIVHYTFLEKLSILNSKVPVKYCTHLMALSSTLSLELGVSSGIRERWEIWVEAQPNWKMTTNGA